MDFITSFLFVFTAFNNQKKLQLPILSFLLDYSGMLNAPSEKWEGQQQNQPRLTLYTH